MNTAQPLHIVVLGGGFAGIGAIKTLLKHKNELRAKITLIDKNTYHLFTPSLYEVATSEEPQKTITIPFKALFGNQVEYIHESVESIDPASHTIKTPTQTISFDFLILSLGSEPAYHHIPGLEEHGLPLKSLQDAVNIKNQIKSLCCKEGTCNRKVRVIIGGGGFSGTELAAELLTYKNKLARQHHLAPDCLDITIIQGSHRLLNELDSHVSTAATKRLDTPQVHFAFGGHIAQVTEIAVLTDDGKTYPYDILIWTGGVQANKLARASGLPVARNGSLLVNDYLQVDTHIFAAGDVAGYLDPKSQTPAPNVCQVAEDQGRIAGENVYRSITHKPILPYQFRHWGYVVPLKGRYASAELMGGWHFDGFIGWILQQLIFLYYLIGIMPVQKAFIRWNRFETHLSQ